MGKNTTSTTRLYESQYHRDGAYNIQSKIIFCCLREHDFAMDTPTSIQFALETSCITLCPINNASSTALRQRNCTETPPMADDLSYTF